MKKELLIPLLLPIMFFFAWIRVLHNFLRGLGVKPWWPYPFGVSGVKLEDKKVKLIRTPLYVKGVIPMVFSVILIIGLPVLVIVFFLLFYDGIIEK